MSRKCLEINFPNIYFRRQRPNSGKGESAGLLWIGVLLLLEAVGDVMFSHVTLQVDLLAETVVTKGALEKRNKRGISGWMDGCSRDEEGKFGNSERV